MVKPIRRIQLPPLRAPQPFLSMCVMFRDNADTLPKLLDSIRGVADEYVFCDTGSVDGSRGLVTKAFPDSKVIDFAWCDDFAKARQANFESATGKWRMFLDSDDQLVLGDHPVRKILRGLEAQHPDVNGCFVPYDYDKLEELPTLRLCRWEDGWRWEDAIHERLVCPPPGEGVLATLAKNEIHVVHKRKTAEGKEAALRRNAVIARREYAETKDAGYKARLARTIAMEMKLDGNIEAALPYLLEVATGYPNLAEGRQAAADLSRWYCKHHDFTQAMSWAKVAGPSYEALIYAAEGKPDKCIAKATQASVAGQQTTHEGLLFEQVFAPMAMAESAFSLKYPPAAVEKVMNSVRSDLRVHPAIQDATVAIRQGIDRITILVPNTPQPFDGSPQSTKSMLGGSEEAVVYLTRALANLGRNVRVYGTLPPLTIPGVDDYGVEWQPFSEFKLHDEHGSLVVWRATPLLHELLETRTALARRAQSGDETAIEPTGIGHGSLWLHDRATGIPEKKWAKAILGSLTSVVVLSDHHQKCIERELPQAHGVKFVKLSNGIVRGDFEPLDWSKRDQNRVIYSSCPSRGLRVLLDCWPEIKAECPDACLDIYYDWSMLRHAQPELYTDIMARYEAVQHLSVKHHGGVGHQELHEALAGANVWAYSHYENTDVETFCVSAVKATAAGCEVITAPGGALPEVAPDATFVEDPKDYANAVICAIKSPRDKDHRRARAEKAADRFDWNRVAVDFSKVWTVRNG